METIVCCKFLEYFKFKRNIISTVGNKATCARTDVGGRKCPQLFYWRRFPRDDKEK